VIERSALQSIDANAEEATTKRMALVMAEGEAVGNLLGL
jgi:hypothetical protein